jgi:hypothetical protein
MIIRDKRALARNFSLLFLRIGLKPVYFAESVNSFLLPPYFPPKPDNPHEKMAYNNSCNYDND